MFLNVCITILARTNEYGLVLPSSRIQQVYEVVVLETWSFDTGSIPMLSHQWPLVLNVVRLGREDEVKIRKSKKQKGTRSEISAPRQIVTSKPHLRLQPVESTLPPSNAPKHMSNDASSKSRKEETTQQAQVAH